MALLVLLGRRAEWEDSFTKKFGVPVDSQVGLTKMIGALCVVAQCDLDVEGLGFIPAALKLVESQTRAMEGLKKELAEVNAKSQAATKRKPSPNGFLPASWCCQRSSGEERCLLMNTCPGSVPKKSLRMPLSTTWLPSWTAMLWAVRCVASSLWTTTTLTD